MPTLRTSDLTASELRERLAALGYTRQVDVAAALKISQSAVSEYFSGNAKVPGWMDVALDGLPRLNGTARHQAVVARSARRSPKPKK